VLAIAATAAAIRLRVRSIAEESEIEAATVINAAGLGAGGLATGTSGVDGYEAPQTRFAKGNYFLYEGGNPFRALVYPLPVEGGLGIHATFDLADRLRFGPDVEWIDTIDYRVDADRRGAFAAAIREYWPDLDEAQLVPGYAGIRPKLSGPGERAADFRIDIAATGTRRQLIHVLGIESPGLTATLALADLVAASVATAAG
jgi:L-2-hydroxyglutarate oxidase LhgO